MFAERHTPNKVTEYDKELCFITYGCAALTGSQTDDGQRAEKQDGQSLHLSFFFLQRQQYQAASGLQQPPSGPSSHAYMHLYTLDSWMRPP